METSCKFQRGSSQRSETISTAGIHVVVKRFPIEETSEETEDRSIKAACAHKSLDTVRKALIKSTNISVSLTLVFPFVFILFILNGHLLEQTTHTS